MLSYHRGTELQGGTSYGQKWKTGTGRQIMDIRGLYSTIVTYLASKATEIGEKRKIRDYIVQGHSRSSRSVSVEIPYAGMRLSISD